MAAHVAREIAAELGSDELRTFGAAATGKRVLCATDLSSRSHHAVGRAAHLAERLNAQLVLLHVVGVGPETASPVDARETIAKQLTSVGFAATREPVIELREGDYIETIATVAKETDAHLIVLGSQRRRPLAPLIGTTAERITELAGRPALIAKLDSRWRYRAVLLAAELSDAFIRVVRVAARLGFLNAESVAVVHGFESPYRGPLYAEGFDVRAAKRNIEQWERAAKARLLRRLDAAGVESSRFHLVFQQARPIRAIQRVVRSIQPDLLIVGTRDRSTLSRVMRGSVANDVLRKIDCDILVAAPDFEATGVMH